MVARAERHAARVAELTAVLADEMGKLRNARLEHIDLHRELAPITWRGTVYSPKEQAKTLTKAYGIARMFEPAGEGLYLFGPNGTGKTTLIASIINAQVAQGREARYGKSVALLRLIRQGFRDGEADDRLEALMRTPLLAIDDLGSEGGSDFDTKSLFDLISAREQANLTTIFTANLPVDTQPDPRVASLIKRSCLILPVITSDYGAILQQRRAV